MTRWLWFAARACAREGTFGPLRAAVSFLRLRGLMKVSREKPLSFLIALEEARELAPLLPPYSPLLAELNSALHDSWTLAHAEEAAFATGTYAMLSGVED